MEWVGMKPLFVSFFSSQAFFFFLLLFCCYPRDLCALLTWSLPSSCEFEKPIFSVFLGAPVWKQRVPMWTRAMNKSSQYILVRLACHQPLDNNTVSRDSLSWPIIEWVENVQPLLQIRKGPSRGISTISTWRMAIMANLKSRWLRTLLFAAAALTNSWAQ